MCIHFVYDAIGIGGEAIMESIFLCSELEVRRKKRPELGASVEKPRRNPFSFFPPWGDKMEPILKVATTPRSWPYNVLVEAINAL